MIKSEYSFIDFSNSFLSSMLRTWSSSCEFFLISFATGNCLITSLSFSVANVLLYIEKTSRIENNSWSIALSVCNGHKILYTHDPLSDIFSEMYTTIHWEHLAICRITIHAIRTSNITTWDQLAILHPLEAGLGVMYWINKGRIERARAEFKRIKPYTSINLDQMGEFESGTPAVWIQWITNGSGCAGEGLSWAYRDSNCKIFFPDLTIIELDQTLKGQSDHLIKLRAPEHPLGGEITKVYDKISSRHSKGGSALFDFSLIWNKWWGRENRDNWNYHRICNHSIQTSQVVFTWKPESSSRHPTPKRRFWNH